MDRYGLVVGIFAAIFTAGQVWTAWLTNRDSNRQHNDNLTRRNAEKEMEDRQVALGIHQELTSLEVQRAKQLVLTDPAQREFVRALFKRCAAKFKLMNDAGVLDAYLAKSLQEELDAIAEIDPEGNKEAADVIARKRGDRSRYTWAGSGSLSKLQLMQRIALEFAGSMPPDHDDFTQRFAAELSTALGRPVDPTKVLVSVPRADPAHMKVAEQVGPVLLDGTEYVVRHTLGLTGTKDYGVLIQLPVIDHFRSRYPIGNAV